MYSKNTLEIMEFLLRNYSSEYNVNQIARRLKISVGSAHGIVKDLEKRKVLDARELGNAIYYRINFNNSEARKLCEIILLKGKEEALRKNAFAKIYSREIEKFRYAKIIVLFGSVLVKKEKAGDVDVLFVIDKKDAGKVNEFCIEVSKTKTKSIVPLIMTYADLRKNIAGNKEVIRDIVKKGVVLFGESLFVRATGGLDEKE